MWSDDPMLRDDIAGVFGVNGLLVLDAFLPDAVCDSLGRDCFVKWLSPIPLCKSGPFNGEPVYDAGD